MRRRTAVLASLPALATLALVLALAAPANAASGTWDRAWGKNVNGGGAFEVCTVAASCLAGETGVLGGEMYSPEGVATDAAGNIYVADTGNQRVQKFDSSGTWERAWGKNVNGGGVFGVCTVAASCHAGTTGGLGGEMGDPERIATDAAGNVYVGESFNNRIEEFNSSGTWERAWGKNVNGGGVFGVCTVAASCLPGTIGELGGEMNFPEGVATDSGGNVYVADDDNDRIQKFDSSGSWERAWGGDVNGGGAFGVCTLAASCQGGTHGGLGGEMDFPQSVATDSGGNLYVAEQSGNRIQKFADPAAPPPVPVPVPTAPATTPSTTPTPSSTTPSPKKCKKKGHKRSAQTAKKKCKKRKK